VVAKPVELLAKRDVVLVAAAVDEVRRMLIIGVMPMPVATAPSRDCARARGRHRGVPRRAGSSE